MENKLEELKITCQMTDLFYTKILIKIVRRKGYKLRDRNFYV